MNTQPTFNLESSRQFEHLRYAPIVEAVIDIRGTLSTPLQEDIANERLSTLDFGYEKVGSRRGFQHQFKIQDGIPAAPELTDLGWHGIHFMSNDRKYQAQFNRDGFVLSRFAPYEGWDRLVLEYRRLWHIYLQVNQIELIERIGVRFVNRIPLTSDNVQLEDYLVVAPKTPKGLDVPLRAFLHQDTLTIPQSPFSLTITRTIQPPTRPGQDAGGLIIDIDVFREEHFAFDQATLDENLERMRWLKNSAFFGSIVPERLGDFR